MKDLRDLTDEDPLKTHPKHSNLNPEPATQKDVVDRLGEEKTAGTDQNRFQPSTVKVKEDAAVFMC